MMLGRMAAPRAQRPFLFLSATLALAVVAAAALGSALDRLSQAATGNELRLATWQVAAVGIPLVLLGAALLRLFQELREQNDRLAREIETRRRAEAERREGASRLEAVVGQMPVILWTVDGDLRLTASMGAGLAAIGEKPNQFVGRHLREALGTEDPDFLPMAAHRRALDGESVTYEMRWKERSFRTHIEPLRDLEGKIVGCIGTAYDITDIERSTETLRFQGRILESMSEGVNVSDEDGTIRFTNPAFDAMFGYAPGELAGTHVSRLNALSPEENERAIAEVAAALKSDGIWRGTFANRRKDGTVFQTSARISVLPLGGRTSWVSVQEDITERLRIEAERQQEKEKAQAYLDSVDVMVVAIGKDQKVQLVNPKGCSLLGYPEGEIVGKNWFDTFLPERVRETAKQVFGRIMAGQIDTVRYHEMTVVTRSGEERLIAWRNAVLHDDRGRIAATISSGDDITHRKLAEKHLHELNARLEQANRDLERLTLVDPLSDLLNRRGLQRVLSQEIQRVTREGNSLAAILVDLDNFKQINDRYGHAVGDVVIKEVARKLKDCLRVTDHACRIGGDEFMVLLPNTRPAEAAAVAERMRLAIASAPLMHSSSPIHVTASLGAVLVSETVASIDELLSLTHLLLYESKHAGKNRASYDWGGPRDKEAAPANAMSRIVSELQRGEHFRVVAHPIMRLADERQVGAELLTRSTLASFESPSDFFRIAQAVNIMTLVDHQCFRKCLEASLRLPAEIHCHLNIFPSTLIDIPIRHLLDDFPRGAPHGRYCVELSEQQIIGDPSHLSDSVRALKANGIQVAIDDVGFGKSCLENLILLEPDVIKIDRKCVFGVGRDKARERSLRRILQTAEGLGSQVVAEGIETREDLSVLKALGVKEGQGYLWSMPAEIAKSPVPTA